MYKLERNTPEKVSPPTGNGGLSLLKLNKLNDVEKPLVQGVTAGFAAIASQFIQESIGHMIPWLIVTGAVIVCDLIFGVRKSLLMDEEVRFSSAVRRTMGKMVT